MIWRLWLLDLALAASVASGQAAAPAADSIRIQSEEKTTGPELIEWVYALNCQADGAAPSLRVTLSHPTDRNANAGVSMPIGPEDRATGTVRVRVTLQDKAAGTYLITAELGTDNPTLIGQTLRLPAGKDLQAVTDLRPAPPGAALRHVIPLGNVGDCALSFYVMPGRTAARNVLPGMPAAEGPAALVVKVFRSWVQGVKTGNLEQFATGAYSGEWNRLTVEQRTQRLQEYQTAFKTVLGDDFDPALFKADFEGSPTAGKLKVRYGEKVLPDLTVRFYGGNWVISETP